MLEATLQQSTRLTHDLALFVESIIAESTGQVIARQVLTEYVAKITDPSQIKDRDTSKEVMKLSLDKIQPKVSTFEEQVRLLRPSISLLDSSRELIETG